MSSSTNQTISLVYPLSVDFAKRSEIEEDVIARSSNNSDTTTVQHNTQVQLDVLEIDYIRPEHLNYETRYIKSRDVIVRRKAIAFPWSYQLYVLIRTETNETRNVSFVRRLLLKHLHSRRCIDRTSRDKNAHGPFQSVAVDLSFTLVLTDIALFDHLFLRFRDVDQTTLSLRIVLLYFKRRTWTVVFDRTIICMRSRSAVVATIKIACNFSC